MPNKLVLRYEDIEVMFFLESIDLYGLHIGYFLGGERPEGVEVGFRLIPFL